MGSIALEEYELMKDSKYRVYVSAVDKALKSFEYTSEWADLISALGKLNKVLLSHMKFPVIPRRIKISKRLAQCMHPALPSGVHLKALETYDIIFKCMGTNRLSHELFIYSAGLFPLLGHAAMNVRPSLLTVYETHFVPLGERLRPGLSGFLSGVLLGLEDGSDHFDRTNSLLEKVCEGVGAEHFYACLWDCLASNSGIRLPAISFVLAHFNKKLSMEEQRYIMGTNTKIMISALCAGVQDTSVLVQRSALDFLLIGFPMHNSQLTHQDMILLIRAALVTILRRDMSLNRRLFAWLLGTEVSTSILKKKTPATADTKENVTYFDMYSKEMLVEAIKYLLKEVCEENSQDLKPYRILVSLLDKVDIGPIILDDILYEVFRTFYNACKQSASSHAPKANEVVKSANLLFSTLEPSYIWIHCGHLFEKACGTGARTQVTIEDVAVRPVGSGMPNLVEVCVLTEFLLETVSLDAFIDTPSEHLPGLFYEITSRLLYHSSILSPTEISKSLKLCGKILSKVQPTMITAHADRCEVDVKLDASLNNITVPSDNSLTAIPLEKSQSDSKLNKPDASSIPFAEKSPSTRRRANSGGAAKRSEKKSKKKASKSTPKLNDTYTIQADGSGISVVVSEDTKHLPRNKSMDDIKASCVETDGISSSKNQSSDSRLSTLKHLKNVTPMGSTGSLCRGPSPAFQAQHSMLEKCLRQYETFYVKLISNRILSRERTVQDMFDHLVVSCPRKSFDERMRHLEYLLNSRLNVDDSGFFSQDTSVTESTKCLDIFRLFLDTAAQSEWIEAMKIASSLFVELSTFPKYFSPGNDVLVEEEPKFEHVLPDWLKVLIVCSCWLQKQPALQLTSIATLLDLVALLKAHNDVETHPKSGEGMTTVIIVPLLKQWHLSYLMQYTNVFQVLAHSLWHHLGELPAHKFRMRCVELLHELHHALYDSCDAVEDLVGSALTSENPEKRIEAFGRFATLWHLGREIETNPRLRGCLRTFDQSLLKMLDNLQLADNSPLKLQAQSWLLHSLMRGDISRVIDPLLTILLDPSTCRMSVLHVSIQHSNTVLTKNDPVEEKSEVQDDTEGAAKIYAISSVDGNVIYHVSDNVDEDKKWKKGKKKKQAINPVKIKRIFAVTTLATGDNCNHYVTERNQFMKELEVPPSISGNRKISVFVNPLSINCNENSNDSLTEDDSLPGMRKGNLTTELLKNATRFKKIDFDKGSTASLDESLFESANSSLKAKDKSSYKKLNDDVDSSSDSITNSLDSSSPEVTNKQSKQKKETVIMPGSSREVAGTIMKGRYYSTNEFSANYDHDIGSFEASAEVPSWTMDDDDGELDASTTAEEYFSNSSASIVEEILNEVLERVMQLCDIAEPPKSEEVPQHNAKTNRNVGLGVHNLHSHMLLYCGVYDSARTLYALRTLRNELLTNMRMFLCCAATTGVTNATKNTVLLNLLARHRKSVFGRNFHGDIANTEFIAAYRSSMYLEVLISVCLYFARSYYPNLGQMRLTYEEIAGNRQVQLASAELLTLIFSELIPIVRDSGKGFSCYIVDLLTKCKVQKVALHCLVSSVMSMKNAHKENEDVSTFTEEIVLFNDPFIDSDVNKCKYRASDHTEAFQIQLLRLLLSLIMLEHQCSSQKGEEINPTTSPIPSSPTRASNLIGNSLKYVSGAAIPQQPMFLASILSALQLDHMRHLHQHWTTLVTSSLPFMGPSLTSVVTSVIHQLCNNIEHLASYYISEEATLTSKLQDISTVECCLPADYTVTHLEALTYLLHYCLLDTSQQIGFSFNQPLSGTIQTGIPGANPGQIFNNLIHVFMPSPLSPDLCTAKDKTGANELQQHARRTALSHLPRIIASLSALWQAVLATKDNEQASCVVGSPRIVKYQLLELLSPISFHHGANFLAAVAVAWHERRQTSAASKKILPEACPNQQVMVHLVSAIRVMPIDTLVHTVHQVVKTPPPIHGIKQDFSLEVSVLELLYVYMQSNTSQSLIESWASLLSLLKDGLSLTAPAQFLLLAILNEYVQKCPPMQEKKDIKDLQDVSAKLIESCSQIAGACLEQTTWLRRNLAVREDVFEVVEGSSEGKEGKNGAVTPGTPPNAAYSVQAQAVLAEILAPLLDVSYGSQEKERVVTLLTNLMYNVTPYLKNHTIKNIASFTACSQLLASLSGYQYTRKAWRKDVLDLLLDSAFFQMIPACLPYWRTIIDNLMTHDNTTFRDLMNRVSMAQGSGISIFSSKEQEYEQKAQLLKRLAFVILCSEMDQYHKYMPEIQERLADSLRLPQVIPSIQAQVFLCFRVLLLRMSPQHATSLWPVIVSELVQVFLYIEQELSTDSEEFSRHSSSHIKLLSALDSSWAVNASNGLQAHGHPHWLQLQLAAAKLLDLALLLPAHRLPQFQMYKWAFVGDAAASCMDNNNLSSDFVPHITRIAKLMDSKFKPEGPPPKRNPGELLLTSNNVRSLQDLHHFFSSLSRATCDTYVPINNTQLETVIEQDFLEKMPAVPAR
ncbi:PREDICTED: protein dopey-1 homolog isoform X1 [Vollenhovia emeryi]|uniref:protein dopey-1 homolog isoform X1 n=1 Tax=Vollenhovia emeryi TaxID=411798 RepID=UPI0005F4680E|nr:PREDICTED: protein dopey-1 homolog isoform X1 [Vollenhovia emeryi]XP_011859861.1 PREDICTED: protein dopey-1 homolog isoform X1 [Vollenhovia emeryi]XP_011859862.1 PREDICTED: protein dopey-1 homolog isoform X1 [Vollenhovia emeryi]